MKMWGGGGQKPYQQPQAQDRRVANRRQLSQFEIELAIEQERCVMERHAEEVIANARYNEMVKESCMNNECYCVPPCKNAVDHAKNMSFKDMISGVKNKRKEN